MNCSYKKNDLLLSEIFDDGMMILVNNNTGLVHIFNKTSLYIYNICDNISINDMKEMYITEYQKYMEDITTLENDFNEVILNMINNSIIIKCENEG